SIAREEGISASELDTIEGTGAQGRVNKEDLMNYISARKSSDSKTSAPEQAAAPAQESAPAAPLSRPAPAQAPAAAPAASAKSSDSISAGEIKVNWPSQN